MGTETGSVRRCAGSLCKVGEVSLCLNAVVRAHGVGWGVEDLGLRVTLGDSPRQAQPSVLTGEKREGT